VDPVEEFGDDRASKTFDSVARRPVEERRHGMLRIDEKTNAGAMSDGTTNPKSGLQVEALTPETEAIRR
jgi:hypothetical protein